MATECARCGRLLVASVENPTIALSSGWFHDHCYRQVIAGREQEAEQKRQEREAREAAAAAAKIEASVARRERMAARWAAAKASGKKTL